MATHQQIPKHQLRISWYDRVSSWLVALLVVVGTTVACLVLIYYSRKLVEGRFAVPLTPVQSGGGGTGGVGAPGFGTDLEPPGAEDALQQSEPTIAETLSAVASAVSTKTALITDDAIDQGIEPVEGASRGDRRRPGFGGGEGGGVGGGIGSGFGPGRGGPPEPRREIRFEPESLREYAEWLDYFKIELGVLGRDNKVYYVYNLSRDEPELRVGEPSQELRLFMNPANSPFAALDRRLAAKAGIADKGDIILQFYPAEAQSILYELELKHAGGRTREQVRYTVFRVTRTGNRFVFSVEEQLYR